MQYDRYEVSEELKESAIVDDIIFSPRRHGSDVAVGVTSSGNLSVTPIDVTLSEKYTIVFRCKHGRFVYEGHLAPQLWKTLVKDQRVTLVYRELYRVTPEGVRTFEDYRLYGVNP